MKFFESVFNVFLSREQRERVSRSKWDKSVAQAARELGIQNNDATPTPFATPASSAPPTPRLKTLNLNTNIPPVATSYPMTPSLSDASTSSDASSGLASPVRSRPSTSYSTSPRPEFRRHLSIQREPISYDALITSKPEKPRRASQDAAPQTQQLLYPLPPLGPMEGIGKYRRSVDVSEEYLDTLQRSTIAALQPFVNSEDRVARFRRGDNRDTTTPPRAYSTSPPLQDVARRQLQMQEDLERWTQELEKEQEFEDITTSSGEAARNRAPVKVSSKRRTYNSRERGRGGRRGAARQGAPQAAGGLSKNLKKGYKPKGPPIKREMELSASMETLVSGEE